MITEAKVSNPNDLKVVSFHNSTDFGFTPEMGCMYDGRPITGVNGLPGIEAGEKITLPYHVGHRLATNLAKRVLNTSQAASVDPAGIPTGVPIWNQTLLEEKAKSYLTDLYTEAKPVAQSETDKLMAKVEEYKKMVDTLIANKSGETPVIEAAQEKSAPQSYQDKAEVIAELEKRGITHDKRKSKAELEKLLA